MPDNFGASRPETGKGLNFHPASYTPTGVIFNYQYVVNRMCGYTKRSGLLSNT